MSEDARNSIKLWAGGIASALLFWAASHFDVLAGVPDEWIWLVVGILIGFNILQSIWVALRRHSIKSENANG